jgi:outer membrane biosynthesis protein TonB
MSSLAMSAPRQSRAPALAAAALLHAAVLALVLFVPGKPPKPVGSSVPINIVSSAPFTDTRPAVQAPQTQTAQAPQPVPEAKPQPPAPVPAPAPAFTETRPQPPVKAERPTPAPAPSPKAVRPTPTPTEQPAMKAAAQPAAKPFDFDRLQRIIASAKRNEGPQASSAPRGPARPETAPQARPDAGQGVSQSDLAGLQQLLERLWNPNCDVPGGSSVKLKVRFLVGLDGGLLGRPNAGGLENASDPVVAAAARRALDAVHRAAPYSEPYYGQTITVNFDAKEACAKR